jgi:GAF domain-containing protein
VRVLALTRNASLLVALGSMMREWEVVNVHDVEAALNEGPGSAVALIDLGTTQDGLSAAAELHRQGVTIPCVVLGDEPAPDETIAVLVRPFSLDDLASAMQDASAKPSIAPRASGLAAKPPAPTANGAAHVEAKEIITPAPPQARSESTPAPEPPATKHPKNRPLSVVPPRRHVAAPKAAAPAATGEPESPPPKGIEQTEGVEHAREVAPSEKTVAEDEREPAPAPVVTQERPARPVQTMPQPQQQTIAASAATAPAEIEESGAQGRWRLRRKPARAAEVLEAAESPLVHQLKKAAQDAAELEALVEELPFLADLSSMADGLAAEVESQFSAQVASVFVRRQDGYHVIAYRGLSKVESGMVVPETQPLFSDVLQTGEGILIQPVDLAQGLVAGIGGARTEALMAVPAVVHGACVAIVIAGQDRFTEEDLDRLSDLATEAAPGLAVALALARLRERI